MKPFDQVTTSHKADKAAFTPSQPSSSPHDFNYIGTKDRIQTSPLRLAASYRPGTAPSIEQVNPLHSGTGRINHNQPEIETFNGNIGHKQTAPFTCKTMSTSVSRLLPTSKETPALLRLPYAENTLKSFSSTRVSEAQMNWVSCTAATSTLIFLSSASKCVLSKCQGLKQTDPLTLLTVDDRPENLRSEDADGLKQRSV